MGAFLSLLSIMNILNPVANFLGISPLRLVIYALCAISTLSGLLIVRHHYVELGYNKALSHVAQQDKHAKAAADRVKQAAVKCNETNGFWDVVSQNCRLGDTP
jgi:hypothetical protein